MTNGSQTDEAILSKTQIEIITKIKEAFQLAEEAKVNPKSDLCENRNFTDYFSNLFAVYHSITEHKFEKKSFEFAFKYASIASGFDCEITKNSSHQGEDVIRDGVRISLKTEGQKNVNNLTISKFSEARFIAESKSEVEERSIRALPKNDPKREQLLSQLVASRSGHRRQTLVENFLTTFRHHFDSYERIIILKANIETDINSEVTGYRYRLIEIPMEILALALTLTPEDFSPVKGNGGSSATVKSAEGKVMFSVVLDGSVEKITLRGIKIDECFTHADFHVRVTV
jgi:hypothetical protein